MRGGQGDGARKLRGRLLFGLSESAIIVGFVSLLSDISTEMIYPLVPIFLTETLAAPKTAVGLIEGIAVGSASLATAFSGWISDLMGRRKPVAFAGYALTAASRPLLALASAWPVVMGARFADRFGKGIRSAPKDALLADSTPPHLWGRAYGFERMMDHAGAVFGPLIGLLLLWLYGEQHISTIFLISTIPAALAALLILAVRETRADKSRANENRADESAAPRLVRLSLAGATPEYKRLLVVTAVFGLANSANAFLILRAEQLGLATGLTIIAYTLFNAVASLFSIPAGAASDRVGRRNLLAAGYIVYAISYLGFALATRAWMVWPLFLLYGLFPALTEGVAKAMAVETAGEAGRATAIGIYSMTLGATQIAASFVGGLLWDLIAPAATFYFGAALALVSVLLLFALFPTRLEKRTV